MGGKGSGRKLPDAADAVRSVTVKLSADRARLLAAMAERSGVSSSRLVRIAVENMIDNDERTSP